jgi:hypothetical protein
MPEIPRLQPVVRVERVGALPVVSVRPCPDDVPALKSFATFADAEAYACALASERGWRLIEAKRG